MIEAGLGTAGLTNVEEVLSQEITIFKDRIRLDVQTSPPGIRFDEAWNRRVTMNYKGQVMEVVSRADLISSKRPAGRDVDLQDVEALESNTKQED